MRKPSPRSHFAETAGRSAGRHGPILALLLLYQLALLALIYAFNELGRPGATPWGIMADGAGFVSFATQPDGLLVCGVQVGLCAAIYFLMDAMRERGLLKRLIVGLALSMVASVAMAVLLWAKIGWTGETTIQSRDVIAARNFLFLVPPIGLWTVTAIVLSHVRVMDERDRIVAELRLAAQDAQLRALRYQLNPHFIFNTLNSLSAMIWDRDWRAAEGMVIAFSDFLRDVLAGDPRQLVPLHQELAMQRKYLAIEQARFGERLEAEIVADGGLDDVTVPNLILQPLIENVVRHAVATSDDPVYMTIHARADTRDAVIEVENVGRTPRTTLAGTGVGLSNVRKRLNAHYGDRATLTCRHLPDGYRATIRLPRLIR